MSYFTDGFRDLVTGWDGHSAPPPYPDAIRWANRIIAKSEAKGFRPTHVMPCVDGGVAIHFPGLTAEAFNSGELVVAKSNGPGKPTVRELRQDEESVDLLIAELR